MPRDHGFHMNEWNPSLFPVNEKHDSVTKSMNVFFFVTDWMYVVGSEFMGNSERDIEFRHNSPV